LAVIDYAAIPTLVDAAGGISVGAVMLVQSERGNDYTQDGKSEQQVFHEVPRYSERQIEKTAQALTGC
jgi:hypothetical protein